MKLGEVSPPEKVRGTAFTRTTRRTGQVKELHVGNDGLSFQFQSVTTKILLLPLAKSTVRLVSDLGERNGARPAYETNVITFTPGGALSYGARKIADIAINTNNKCYS